MNKEYKILWVDDQHEDREMIQFIIDAESEGLLLNGYASFEEAFEVLEKHIPIFDAILLDGMFFERKDQVAGTEDEVGIGMAIARINELKSKKVFPWFVLSGKEQFTKSKNSILTANRKRCFDKTNPKDVVELFTVIKQEADQQLNTQLRHNHRDIFSVFANGYLPKEIELQVFDLIISPLPETRVDIKSMLSNIRSIHESFFLKLEAIGVIPDTTAKFNTKEYQNDAIENLNKWLYFTCGKYIHNLKDENYNGYMISKYAVDSLRTGLLELLLWFKKTYEENK
jgi:CheY-like chemotaxis protein